MPAVPEDRDAARDLKHLLQPVGDVDDGHPFLRKALDQAQQILGFTRSQGGSRLIKDQHRRGPRHRPGNLHHLLLRHPQVAHAPLRVQLGCNVDLTLVPGQAQGAVVRLVGRQVAFRRPQRAGPDGEFQAQGLGAPPGQCRCERYVVAH